MLLTNPRTDIILPKVKADLEKKLLVAPKLFFTEDLNKDELDLIDFKPLGAFFLFD